MFAELSIMFDLEWVSRSLIYVFLALCEKMKWSNKGARFRDAVQDARCQTNNSNCFKDDGPKSYGSICFRLSDRQRWFIHAGWLIFFGASGSFGTTVVLKLLGSMWRRVSWWRAFLCKLPVLEAVLLCCWGQLKVVRSWFRADHGKSHGSLMSRSILVFWPLWWAPRYSAAFLV